MAGEKTKVLFIFNATTHYYNLVLNKLNIDTDFEIHMAVPKMRVHNVGAGVYQTEDNLKIPLYPLEEKSNNIWRSHFPELLPLLWKLRPKIIVCLEPYQWGIFFNPIVWFTLKILGIKMVLKSIPFQLPDKESPLERLKRELKISALTLRKIVGARWWLYYEYTLAWMYKNGYDAHVCYIQKAFEKYGTYGVPAERIYLTFNSPDTDLLMSINEKVKGLEPILPSNPHRLLHVGRLVDWKRVDLIIDAVANLKDKYTDIELIVVGFGPKEQEWKDHAGKMGVADRVKFVGGVYDLEILGKYFRASSIYVLGGMGGLSINDAMSFERPILCSVCDGTEAHLVKDGYNGYYFENGNSKDLTDKVDKMFSNPSLLNEMGKNSYSIIKNDININRVLEGYTGAFNYVLGRSNKR